MPVYTRRKCATKSASIIKDGPGLVTLDMHLLTVVYTPIGDKGEYSF